MPKEIEFILKDFVRHVVDLKAEDDPAGTGFHREFRILREEQIQNKNDNRFPNEDGKKEECTKKNRYKDILPRDDRRVKLAEVEGEKGSDYINATFIEDVNGQYGYIASQGPMPHTVCDFWRMLWQYNTEIVFMACKLKEDGRPKCEQYWAEPGESITFGDITVHTETEDEIQEHFYKRQLRAEKDGDSHTLTQFHYVGWPDHNTPSSPDALRKMIEDVRKFRRHLDIPMVVHCSAGCGRTGTICAIDYAWTLLDRGMIKEEFSMFEIIKSMREQRMSMVQTPDQYEYTHMVMKSLCNEWLVSFTIHDYENIEICQPSVEEEEVDETYANVDVDADDNNSTGLPSLVTDRWSLEEPKTEHVQLTRNAQSSIDTVPEPKPQESRRNPYDNAVVGTQGPQIGDTIPISTGTRPKTILISNPCDSGEYVEVQPNATLSPSSPPPGLPTKKNPPSNFSKLDPVKIAPVISAKPPGSPAKSPTSPGKSTSSSDFDPHKTVIMVGGGNSVPKIIQSGSVSVGSTKRQAPKPPAAQAVVKPMTASEQQNAQKGMQLPSPIIDADYSVVNKTASGHLEENSERKSVEEAVGKNVLDAPVLPARNYKPEEATQSIASTPSVNNTTQDNVARVQPTLHPQNTISSAISNQNRDRPPQPLPVTQSHTRAVITQAKAPQPVAASRSTGAHVPGMVSAVGGVPTHPVPQKRGMGKADKRGMGGPSNQPVLVSQSAAHRGGRGPVVVQQSRHPHSSTSTLKGKKIFKQFISCRRKSEKEDREPRLVAAPGPGQVLVANTRKIVYSADRPPRVKGPRQIPAGWRTTSESTQKTYL